MITIKFFASLQTIVGKDEVMIFAKQKKMTLDNLLKEISIQFPSIAPLLKEKKVMIAVNQEIADLKTIVKDNDEIALMPPFSGGTG